MNLPNALTISRLVAIPVLMALLLLRFPGHDQLAAALFIAFSFTDTLDGQLARRRGLVSRKFCFVELRLCQNFLRKSTRRAKLGFRLMGRV